LEAAIILLRPFQELTLEFSGDDATLSAVLPAVMMLNHFIQEQAADGVKALKQSLLQALVVRFHNQS
jgi:hypothetical protein